jgi:site-specific recombinase XerD
LTRLAEAGVDPLVLMRVAGHTSLRMVERYTHLGQEQVAEAFEKLAPAPAQLPAGDAQTLHPAH